MLIDLNCDLGEGCPYDAELMPLITSANVACGFHAGDPSTARAALRLAARHGVQVGALAGLARAEGLSLRYVKPHGALYNLACRADDYARPVVAATELFGLALMALPGSRLEALSAGRCPFVMDICRVEEPGLLRISENRTARCWLYDEKVMAQQGAVAEKAQ